MREETIHYLHDASQFQEVLVIKRLGYKDHLYRVELGFTDPTDYERVLLYLKLTFQRTKCEVK